MKLYTDFRLSNKGHDLERRTSWGSGGFGRFDTFIQLVEPYWYKTNSFQYSFRFGIGN